MKTTTPSAVLLLSAWSTTTTAFETHQYRNSRQYTDTPRSRWEKAALKGYKKVGAA